MKTPEKTCLKFLLILFSYCSATNYFQHYDGYKVYILKTTPEKAYFLKRNNTGLDFWNHINKIDSRPLRVMVKPQLERNFIKYVRDNNIDHKLLIKNVSQILYKEYLEKIITFKSKRIKSKEEKITFDYYLNNNEINSYLNYLTQVYRNIVSLKRIGDSFEGNKIYCVKISTRHSSSEDTNGKPAILIDAGIHAREWIAPATALYIINQLVENKENEDLIRNIDWYIIPCLNPDGYEYSHTNDRFWRKTRSKLRNSACAGVDGNRNFNFLWGLAGSSDNPCADDYRGPYAFSEPELKSFRHFATSIRNNIKLYLSFHSFGRYIMFPYGHNGLAPYNQDELYELAKNVGRAMYKFNEKKWIIGNVANVMYSATGTAEDWMMAKNYVDLCYVMELQGEDDHEEFELHPSKILEAVRETFEGIKVFHSYVERKYYFNIK